jgi:ectoine hydroxylase-related dioxygenase (phytanoyl-CoA dioxygenase family)
MVMPTLTESGCRLTDFVEVLADRTDPTAYPHAAAIEQEVLIYDRDGLLAAPDDELVHALSEGPGVVVIRGAYPDVSVVDRTTAVFEQLMKEQRDAGHAAGDHFAPFGVNERVWNALEKLAVTAPGVFVDYYSNEVVAKIANAWLGPAYQVTSQVNVVNPGGVAQSGHRDYHLGFLANETIARYPAHVQRLSPVLTLQGAVAHTDMPLVSGPTMYLPHSQKYLPGYLAMNLPEFQAYFVEHHIQLPLRRGDAGFFNPAVFHGAGSNHSADFRRIANLLQISSAFGRAMENVDRTRMSAALYTALQAHPHPENAVAASAEGYAFPTNLDRDAAVEGLSPPSQADLVRQALAEGWAEDRFRSALDAHAHLHETH